MSTPPLVALQTSTDVAMSSSTTDSPPTSTGGPPNGGGSPAGSELYLFTFLTTLLLLLGVSCAIIIRSLILRRRFRRRVQEAIANGVLVPGLITEPMPRPLGEKPKMWNVWIGDPKNQLANSDPAANEDGESKSNGASPNDLADVLPVSATKLESLDTTSPWIPSGLMPSHFRAQESNAHRAFFRRIIPRPPPLPTVQASDSAPRLEAQDQQAEASSQTSSAIAPGSSGATPPSGSLTPDPSKSSPNTVQVSLLIAMPSASRSQYAAYVARSNSPPAGPVTTSPAAPTDAADAAPPTESGSPDIPSTDPVDSHDKHSHRLSESSLAKGKAPDHSHPHPHPHGAWSHLEEGEIPYMELGIIEVAMEEEKQNGVQQQSQQGITTVSGAVSR